MREHRQLHSTGVTPGLVSCRISGLPMHQVAQRMILLALHTGIRALAIPTQILRASISIAPLPLCSGGQGALLEYCLA